MSSHELLSVPWVNKLQLQITNSRGNATFYEKQSFS